MKILFFLALPLLAQKPVSVTGLNVYDRPNSSVKRQEFASGSHVVLNSAGARRVNITSSGGLSTTVGIVEVTTGVAGSESFVSRLDSAGIRTTRDLRLETPDGIYAGWQVSPVMTTSFKWQMPIADADGFMKSNGSGVTSWSTDVATLSTAQTLTGAKIFKAAITVEDALSAVDRSVLGSGTLGLNNTSGASRVLLSSSTGADSSGGILRVLTGAAGIESIVAEATVNGINVNAPAAYRYNGTAGVTQTCGFGQYPNSFISLGGMVAGFTCTSLPAVSGDMLLGTAQTVTALKTFQMTSGGDAIRVNNLFGQTRGAWSDATLSVGDVASGFGRGIQLSTGGTFQIFNAAGQVAVRFSFTGTAGSSQVLDSSGIARTGLSQTCITTNGGQITFVAGLAVGCL